LSDLTEFAAQEIRSLRRLFVEQGKRPMKPEYELAAEHYYLVEQVAKSVYSKMPHVNFSDLLSSGSEGLLKASESFRPEMNIPFEVYARIRIHGAMIDDIRKMDWVPRYQRERQKKLEAYAPAVTTVSFDVLVSDMVEDSRTTPVDEQVENRELVEELARALARLPEKERQAMILYYYEELKMHEIATVLSVSESYVSKLVSTAVRRLRGMLRSSRGKR
jgi:RNA polymerase sigma factor for flagellar operon FliA